MKFIKPFAEQVLQEPGLIGIIEHIERCGRVSYKSEDKITDGSAEKFLAMLTERGHTAPLEHGTVYLTIPDEQMTKEHRLLLKDPYTVYREGVENDKDVYYITTNYRVINDHGLFDFLDFLSDIPSEQHIKRYTFRIVCSRGVSHELVRHRVFSFVQESTRYCNYSKDKHENCITFIIPSWAKDLKDGSQFGTKDIETDTIVRYALEGKMSAPSLALMANNVCCENCYMELLKLQGKPQDARDVLTNGVKTEIMMTGSLSQWKHFLKLRSPKYGAKGAHPDMAVIGDIIYDELHRMDLV